MTEEQRALFQSETMRIAHEIMGLAMEFPGMAHITITATDGGYFDATISDEDNIYDYSKVAGHPPYFHIIEIDKEDESA